MAPGVFLESLRQIDWETHFFSQTKFGEKCWMHRNTEHELKLPKMRIENLDSHKTTFEMCIGSFVSM